MAYEGTDGVTHITYNYEFIDDFDDPELGAMGNFMLEKLPSFKSKQQQRDIPLIMINKQAESNLSAHRQSLRQSDISIEFPQSNWRPHVFDKNNHTMSLMVMR